MPANIPVLVGAVPLLMVQSYVVNEGYKSASIARANLMQAMAIARTGRRPKFRAGSNNGPNGSTR